MDATKHIARYKQVQVVTWALLSFVSGAESLYSFIGIKHNVVHAATGHFQSMFSDLNYLEVTYPLWKMETTLLKLELLEDSY